jgi:hypothetical protein
MRGPGKGNTNNPDGRPLGSQNRTTKEGKELLEQILLGQIDNIKEALETIKTKDPGRYLDACSKLFSYVLPRKTDITTGDEPLQQININVSSNDNADKLRAFVNGGKSK